MGFSRPFTIAGPAGPLEGLIQGRADPPPSRVAVVCHPHPLGGGTLHTKVVHRAARALEASGHRVLRFNFRGVGASAGVHDRGGGEQEDVRAALAAIGALHPGLPATVAGFSFGAWVGLRVGADDPRVTALVGIAPPVNLYDFGFLTTCPKPKLVVHGTADAVAPFEALLDLYPKLAEPKLLVRLEGGSHLLTDHLDPVEAAILDFARGLPAAA
jgi:alpha/beta superfamily hydrolase